MSIVEQAARRLEELKRSGIEVPQRSAPAEKDKPAARIGLPAAAALHAVEALKARPTAASEPAQPAGRVAQPADSVPQPAEGAVRSRQVELDLGRLSVMGYLTPSATRSRIADDFRVIKRPLLANTQSQPPQSIKDANLIMVTSALPGEGKTFVAVNLAVSMAMELDRTVLLVDADVARPSVLSRLGLPPAPGFLDVLADSSMQLSDVMLRTNISKLGILPSGVPRHQATEILASEAMNRLLADLASRYPDRIVIFDAPPLLPSTESRVLATRMGQVILVVEAKRTPQTAVLQALATVESSPVVMTLLNKAGRSDGGFYYGYYGPGEK